MTSPQIPLTIEDVREIFTKAFSGLFDRRQLHEIGEGQLLAATARASSVHPDLLDNFMVSWTRSEQYLEPSISQHIGILGGGDA